MAAAIHVGIGGWDFDPWRGTFYPAGLAKAKQLEHLGTRFNATEVNATYYGSMSPATFAKWAKSVPEGFKFALKASRFCTNRKHLGEAAESIGRFCAQGFTELGDRLGPILWQLAPTKKFDADELRAFLMLLPTSRDGIKLQHALEVRNESFRCREFVALARASQVAIAFAHHETYPEIADITADFVYARLQQAKEAEPAGYDAKALDRWAAVARGWAKGESPDGLAYVSDAKPETTPREVFTFFISGDKVRNPAAAEALTERLQ
ncbi:MAG: hypothetical protein QOD42_1916 [Sphingomonadales bacterium]|jgi:uncharacterized protein YecE (DUF72 family)|nr:hypothetical protein [Sphingomonadales bacterium]